MRFVKNVVAGALAAGTLIAAPAQAQMLTYSTLFQFTGGGCVGLSCTINGVTLTFIEEVAQSIMTPTVANLGLVQSIGTPLAGGEADFSGVTFSLQVIENAPGGGSDFMSGNFTGSIFSPTQSTAFINFTDATATLPSTTVTTVNVQYGINPPAVGVIPGSTTVNATFTGVVPEPSTYALMATGLVGIFGLARRRRQA